MPTNELSSTKASRMCLPVSPVAPTRITFDLVIVDEREGC